MKVIKNLVPLTAAATFVLSTFAAPVVVAGTTASVGIANMYLWRGVNVSPNGAQVSGELKYSDASGAYGGLWTSSEDAGHETDLFFGYAGKAGGISYDISYWNYLYPENTVGDAGDPTATPPVAPTPFKRPGLFDNNAAEIVGTISQGPYAASVYINVDGDNDDNNYLTLSYTWSKYTATYGLWSFENSGGDEYSHLTVKYAATDDLSFTVSKAFSDLKDTDPGSVEEDFLVQVAYGWSFDLDKKM